MLRILTPILSEQWFHGDLAINDQESSRKTRLVTRVKDLIFLPPIGGLDAAMVLASAANEQPETSQLDEDLVDAMVYVLMAKNSK